MVVIEWPGIGREDRADSEPAHSRLEAVAELTQRIQDIGALADDDDEHPGRTVLWTAVFANRPDRARVLVAAGADPLRLPERDGRK
ncbi:hypothetical protein [Nonomuraea sp. NPDC002799]